MKKDGVSLSFCCAEPGDGCLRKEMMCFPFCHCPRQKSLGERGRVWRGEAPFWRKGPLPLQTFPRKIPQQQDPPAACACVPLGGVRIFRRVTDGEDVFRLCPFGDAELLAYGRGIEMHEPAAAQAQIRRFQKHVCRRYRRVGVGLALAVKGTHPDFGSNTADDDRQRVAFHVGAGGKFFQPFRVLHDEEPERLGIFRRWSYAPRLKVRSSFSASQVWGDTSGRHIFFGQAKGNRSWQTSKVVYLYYRGTIHSCKYAHFYPIVPKKILRGRLAA